MPTHKVKEPSCRSSYTSPAIHGLVKSLMHASPIISTANYEVIITIKPLNNP